MLDIILSNESFSSKRRYSEYQNPTFYYFKRNDLNANDLRVTAVQISVAVPGRPRSQPGEAEQPAVRDSWPADRRVAEAVQEMGHYVSVVRRGSGAVRKGARPAHSEVVRRAERRGNQGRIAHALPFG